MDHNEVLLIGVFDPDGVDEGFVYTVDAPTNLWVSALTEEGSRMGNQFMAYGLNRLLDDDCFDEGDWVEFKDQADKTIRFTVCDLVPRDDVSAFKAETATVRRVRVEVR